MRMESHWEQADDRRLETELPCEGCYQRVFFTQDLQKSLRGVCLLPELIHKGTKDDQRDYLFYLAVANYKFKEYERALKYIRTLLRNEPGNSQALDLEKLINKTMKKDGLVGMAIVGGIGLGLAGLAGLIGLAVAKKSA
ncbi:mitochondrial fission 1 protein-like [Rhinichthys klamathensis goyatoka]|uniref:mitochondrial fission 1 protein-like n=1 Tax=Rhinichthys klamathensis goyatoka TaxID=3034132 RepID=UPI0024B55567|nr:mitochondrial fission 1 protein-like [Rhinichthys klamathensis goyatoka]